jgi:UDP-glucose 4-epimerase
MTISPNLRVLITGGAGFIGSHLAERHLQQGDSVTVLDNLSSGSPANLSSIADSSSFSLHHGCITNERLVCELMSHADVAYHLAAVVGVKNNLSSPVRALRTHLFGTESVLAAADKYGVRIIVASTSEVYGIRENIPFRETETLAIESPRTLRFAYASAKLTDEFLSAAYHCESGLPVTVVRLFNVVGPRQSADQGMVLPTFIAQARAGTPITVYGSGAQTRSFCHVDDVVQALMRLGADLRTCGDVFNVGSEEEISMLQLAGLVCKLSGSASRITCIPYSEVFPTGFADMPRRVPSLEKLRTIIPEFCPRPVQSTIEELLNTGAYARYGDHSKAASALM